MYLPLAAVVSLVVVGSYRLVRRWAAADWLAWSLAGAIVLALAVATHARIEHYRTPLSIWEDTVSKSPHNFRGHCTLAIEYEANGQPERAMQEAQLAIADRPQDFDARNSLAVARIGLGQFNTALAALDSALQVARGDRQRAVVLFNRSVAHDRLGQHEAALADATQWIEIDPQNAEAYNQRGIVLQKLQRFDAAIDDFDQAVALRSDDPRLYHNRGITYGMMGRPAESLPDLTAAIELAPQQAQWYASRAVSWRGWARLPRLGTIWKWWLGCTARSIRSCGRPLPAAQALPQ